MYRLSMLFIFSGSILFAQTDSVVTIRIHSNYERANIFLDDLETPYLTPSRIPDVKTGKHKVTLRWIDLLNRSEYVAEDTIEVAVEDSNSFWIEFKPVSVTLVCNAEHTKLYLNGRLRGEGGDLVIDRIIPGTYNLRLKQGYGLTAEKQVYFPPNSSDCPPECFIFGNLNVVSEEINDVPILINGIRTDRRVPAVFNNLIIGEYEVSAEIDGKRVSRKAVVKANEENYVHLNPIEIAKELKELEAVQAALLKEKQRLKEQKERAEKELQKSREAAKPKEKLNFQIGITAGLNVSYYGKITASKRLNYGRFNYGAFVDIPFFDFLYIRNEVRHFSKKFSYDDRKFEGDTYTANISYFYNFVLLRKNLYQGIYVIGGGGMGLRQKSKKILYETVNGVEHYTNDNRGDKSWTLGFGFDPSHDFSVEIRFNKSITRFSPEHTPLNVQAKTIFLNANYYLDYMAIYKRAKELF